MHCRRQCAQHHCCALPCQVVCGTVARAVSGLSDLTLCIVWHQPAIRNCHSQPSAMQTFSSSASECMFSLSRSVSGRATALFQNVQHRHSQNGSPRHAFRLPQQSTSYVSTSTAMHIMFFDYHSSTRAGTHSPDRLQQTSSSLGCHLPLKH